MKVKDYSTYYEILSGKWKIWVFGDHLSIWNSNKIDIHLWDNGNVTFHSGKINHLSKRCLEDIMPLIDKKLYILWKMTR